MSLVYTGLLTVTVAPVPSVSARGSRDPPGLSVGVLGGVGVVGVTLAYTGLLTVTFAPVPSGPARGSRDPPGLSVGVLGGVGPGAGVSLVSSWRPALL